MGRWYGHSDRYPEKAEGWFSTPEPLCEDEGCMMHDIPHVCVEAPKPATTRDVWTETAEKRAEDGIRWAQELAHNTALEAGWHDKPRDMAVSIALMHSELSEALEADRKSLMDDKLPHRPGVEVEFADAIIRILDTAAAHGLDVAGALIEKNRFNKQRPDHKPEARAGANGKRY